MRYLILSDIHANLEALESVLEAAGAFHAAVCPGDVVGYGPDPNACVDRVAGLPNLTCVLGNHDVAALGRLDVNEFNDDAREAALWTQSQLSESSRGFLRSLGEVEELEGFSVTHGSPRNHIWEYLDPKLLSQRDVLENFANFRGSLCFIGHTHKPLVYSQDIASLQATVRVPTSNERLEVLDNPRLIINPGGVGQPRDGDARASFGLYDTEARAFEYRRIEYDVESTQAKMRKAGLPEKLALRLAHGW